MFVRGFLLQCIATCIVCFVHAQSYSVQWARQMGGKDFENGRSIVVDTEGNVYTTGGFMGTADFDPGEDTFELTSSGGMDVFLSKLDAEGRFVWAKRWGGSNHEFGSAIAIDADGHLVVTGYFESPVDFDPGENSFLLTADYVDVFVSKLDTAGQFIWAKKLGGESIEYAYGLATDSLGHSYLTGRFWQTADFDPGPGTFHLTSQGKDDIFVCKLDSLGDLVWARHMGGGDFDYGNDIAVDKELHVYTTGYFTGQADFDPGNGAYLLTARGDKDIFVSKLDSLGRFKWARQLTGEQALIITFGGVPPGVYLLIIQTEAWHRVDKMVIE